MIQKDYCGQNIEDLLAEVGFPIRDYQFCLQGSGVLIREKVSLYEAQKWLREEKKIEVLVLSKGMVGAPYDVQVYTEDYVNQMGIEYSSYEEALLEGIKEAIEILKDEEAN